MIIENDRILNVGKELSKDDYSKADQTVDLHGLSISSGFIDVHSHNDWFVIKKEPIKYVDPFIRQGITTFVTGNCGISAIGFEEGTPYLDMMGGGLFSYMNANGPYGTAREFFDAIDHKNPCNMAVLVGHCSARAGVSGMKNTPLTPAEETKMLGIIEKALSEGACGVSLGLMYEPGIYAQKDELKKIAGLCEKHNKLLTVHPRANSAVSLAYKNIFGRSHLLRAVDELVDIAKGTHLKLQYSHAIFVGRKSFADKDEFLQIMHNLKKTGVDAMFDIYHQVLGVSVITVILPAWYQSMSLRQKKNPINKLKLSMMCSLTSKFLGFGFPDIQIAYIGEGYEQYEGKTVHQIAQETGKSDIDAYLELCEFSNFKGRVNMGPYSTPQIISEFSKDSQCLYMTDAWVENYGVQNPSIYDCFPKFIKASLTGTGDTMPNTIRRMTGGAADRFMLPERGYLKPGYFADLTIFNEEKMKTEKADREKSFGIEKVYINGKLVLDGDRLNHEVLKTSGAAVRVL